MKKIPQEELDRAIRKACRSIAATLIKCMADTDISFAMIAVRLETTEAQIREVMTKLTDGCEVDLNLVTDICTAMEAQLTFSAAPCPFGSLSIKFSDTNSSKSVLITLGGSTRKRNARVSIIARDLS